MPAPAWFRYGIIAIATLMLCSCRAMPEQSASNVSSPSLREAAVARTQSVHPSDSISPSRASHAATQFNTRGIDPNIMPVVYQSESNTPPPANRRAEYAAGMRAGYPCGNGGAGFRSGQCGPHGCGLGGCQPGGCAPCSLVGPRDEYLCDGGDDGLTAGVRADWQVEGLEQEDTIAHYDTVDGRTVVTPSNQVCIYAPRFGVVRRSIDLHEYARADMPGGMETPLSLAKIDENERATTSLNQLEPTINRAEDPANLARNRNQLGELDRTLVVEEYDGSLAAYADLQLIRAGTVSNNEKALVSRASLAAITWAGDQSPQITIGEKHAQAAISDKQPGVLYHLHDPKKPTLRLVKLASTGLANPGDEVEFTLRFDNIGSQVVGNVTIMDNLTTRLEYVEGSQKSSVEANFSAQPNTGGSVVLRWEITEPLEAGEGGVLQFKCKVR
ncbi:MAG: hypothetical protein AAGD11_00305 [Planctomycetota bacterium]